MSVKRPVRLAPTRKVTASTVGGLLGALVAYLLARNGVHIDPYVGGLIAAGLTALCGWLVKEAPKPVDVAVAEAWQAACRLFPDLAADVPPEPGAAPAPAAGLTPDEPAATPDVPVAAPASPPPSAGTAAPTA